MKLRRRIYGMVICFFLVFLTACNGQSKELAGNTESENSVSIEEVIPEETIKPVVDERLCKSWYPQGSRIIAFTLYSDERCEIGEEYGSGRWSVENGDQLKLSHYYGASEVYTITSIDDQSLVLADQNGVITTYWNEAPLSMIAAAKAEAEIEPVYTERFAALGDYSEGRAWVERKYDKSYYACINKSGEVLFQFPAEGVETVSDFSGGYAHIVCRDYVAVVDAEGNVCSSYELDENNVLMAYGDGYTVIESYSGGFDFSTYEYTLYDADGAIVCDYFYENREDGDHVIIVGSGTDRAWNRVSYIGKGVFKFEYWGGLSTTDFNLLYYTHADENDKFVFYWNYYKSIGDIYYYDEIVHIRDEYNEETVRLSFADNIGSDVYFLELEHYYWNNLVETYVSEGKYILYNFCDTLATYDLDSGSIHYLDDSYTEKVIWDKRPSLLVFQNDRIALPMEGSDGEDYVAIFDSRWNIIQEPMRMDDYRNFSDGILTVILDGETYVYDEVGEIVFTYSDVGYSSLADYSDGAALVTEDNVGVIYLDKEGNLLFEAIDSSSVVDISENLPWWDGNNKE